MLQITEEEYVMKFGLLLILDERKASGMDRYADSFKNILESYSRVLKARPGVVVREPALDTESLEYREQVRTLIRFCQRGSIHTLLEQRNPDPLALFSILVEAIYRTMILVRCFAPDGETASKLLMETYCSGEDKSETQLVKTLNLSRATYYRRRKKAIAYAGYYFYEAVLPEMEGRI